MLVVGVHPRFCFLDVLPSTMQTYTLFIHSMEISQVNFRTNSTRVNLMLLIKLLDIVCHQQGRKKQVKVGGALAFRGTFS